jgi:uncharacterized protein
MAPTESIIALLTQFIRWASQEDTIQAVALVGSYARNEARGDSDVDLVVLTTNPAGFRQQMDWMEVIPWHHLQVQVSRWADEDYGILWSRRLFLNTGLEIEVGFAPPVWAAIDPIDKGTQQVIQEGCWILLDPTGLLNHLVKALDQHQ